MIHLEKDFDANVRSDVWLAKPENLA